jgi:tyrosine-protein phosphatase SIW14
MMNLHNLIIQVAFLYAPFVHGKIEQVTPTLYRGLDPKASVIHKLHDEGIKTIISLRTNPEWKKQRLCEELGMSWIQIKTGVFKTPTHEQFDQFRSIVNDPKYQPCYTACEVDMDRTGVYIAAYRMVDQHWTAEQMDAELKEHHQKTWWPIFRKYQKDVIAYAKEKLEAKDASKTVVSSSEQVP